MPTGIGVFLCENVVFDDNRSSGQFGEGEGGDEVAGGCGPIIGYKAGTVGEEADYLRGGDAAFPQGAEGEVLLALGEAVAVGA